MRILAWVPIGHIFCVLMWQPNRLKSLITCRNLAADWKSVNSTGAIKG